MERAGKSILPLHIAEPTNSPSPAVIAALHDALDKPFVYTSVHGLPEFAEAIIQKLKTVNGIEVPVDHIFVCPGASQGMLSLERMLASEGGEILLPSIHWPLHLQQALVAGFRPRFYPLVHDFQVDVNAVEAAATDDTRVLFLNSPHNPTGAVYSEDTLRDLLALARRRDWMIISDEAYEDFVYDGEHVSIASLERDVSPEQRRVYSVFTFSKSHALGTCRLGYIVAPNQEAADAFTIVQEASIMAPSTLIQIAGIAALGNTEEVAKTRQRIRENRELLLPLVERGMLRTFPAGGWYTLIDLAPHAGAPFAEQLLAETGVALVPADGFALRPKFHEGQLISAEPDADVARLVRIAYSGHQADLKEGLRRLIELWENGAHN